MSRITKIPSIRSAGIFLFSLGAVALSGPLFAQEEPAEALDTVPVEESAAAQSATEGESTELDAIEVTGSRIRRTDYETAQPIAVVTRDDIERTGLTNIGDILQRIPSAGSALNRSFNNGGNGQTEIDLRNLGSNRVLVLVNGHRWVSGTSLGDSSVDLNTIPVSIIERIEVLKDGASAVYGSDAITGVVNIITRRDFSGAEFGSQLQVFEDGEGLTQAHHISLGNVTGKTSMFLDVNFVRQDEVFAGSRPQSATPQIGTDVILSGVNFENELVVTRGSAIGPEGLAVFVPRPDNLAALGFEKCPALVGGQALVNGTLEGEGLPGIPPLLPDMVGINLCQISPIRGSVVNGVSPAAVEASKFRFNGAVLGQPDIYQHNFAPINYLLTPFEQNSVFTQVNHQFLDWLNFQSRVLYNVAKADQAIAEEPLRAGDLFAAPQSQAYLDATQIYNPFDQDIGRSNTGGMVPPDAQLIGLGAVVRRMVEAGPRFSGRENRSLFLSGQFDGNFDFLNRFMSYDLGYSHAQNDQAVEIRGAFNMERVAAALGPANRCPSPDNPTCVPLNIFAPVGGITPEMLEYVSYNATSTAKASSEDAYFNLSTELDELTDLLPFNILSAPIGIAFGAEYRSESFGERPDGFAEQGISSNLNRKATNGEQHAKEAYIELALPLVSDVFLFDELDLSIAARRTEYNTFDPKTTGKFGLRWKPFEDLLIRGTKSTAFRAPNLQELFLGPLESFPAQTDPCVGRAEGSNVDMNCDAENVPTGATQTAQIRNAFEGNPNLDPESADTFTAGFVYSPSFIEDFNFYVDYFDIVVDDFIGFVSGDFILESCYERPAGAPRPATCDLIQRNATGAITGISVAPINFGKLETSGVDVAFDYILPFARAFPSLAGIGTFKVLFDSQYLMDYEQFLLNSEGGLDRQGINNKDTDGLAGDNLGDQPLPRLKANATLEWGLDNFKASWATRFIEGTTEVCDDGLAPSLAELGLCTNPDTDLEDGSDDSTNDLDDVFYHNVQFGYVIPTWDTEFTLGVINVLDEQPPVSTAAFANSAVSTLYETWNSRQGYLRFNIKF